MLNQFLDDLYVGDERVGAASSDGVEQVVAGPARNGHPVDGRLGRAGAAGQSHGAAAGQSRGGPENR